MKSNPIIDAGKTVERVPIMPLAIGNTWTYMNIRFTRPTTGGIKADTTILEYSITNDTTIDTSRWWKYGLVWSSDSLRKVGNPSFFQLRGDGLWIGMPDGTDLKMGLIVPYPATTGDTSHIRYYDDVGGISFNQTVEVIATDTTIVVPAGTFESCLEYLYTLDLTGDWMSIVDYSPGTGLVHADSWRVDVLGGGPGSGYHPPDSRLLLQKFETARN